MPLVFTCPQGSQGTATVMLGGSEYGTCAAGQGAWTEFADLVESTEPAPLPDAADASAAFGAGFGIFGIGLLLSMAVRTVVQFVRSA